MAAITGLPRFGRVGPIGLRGPALPSSGNSNRRCVPALSGVAMLRTARLFRSVPAQNAPPSPHRTATLTVFSRSKSTRAWYNASTSPRQTAVRTSGRALMAVITRSWRWVWNGIGFSRSQSSNTAAVNAGPNLPRTAARRRVDRYPRTSRCPRRTSAHRKSREHAPRPSDFADAP